MNVKSSTRRIKEGIISLSGTIFFAQFCLQFTARTTQTAVMMTPMAGKNKLDEYELGTPLVHVVFVEKSYPKVLICGVLTWTTLVVRGTKHRKATSI